MKKCLNFSFWIKVKMFDSFVVYVAGLYCRKTCAVVLWKIKGTWRVDWILVNPCCYCYFIAARSKIVYFNSWKNELDWIWKWICTCCFQRNPIYVKDMITVSLAIIHLHRNHIQMNTFNETSLKLDCRSSFDKDWWHLLKLSTSSSVFFYLAMFVSIWADSLSFSNRMFNEDFKKLNLIKNNDNWSTHIQTHNWSCPILRSIDA